MRLRLAWLLHPIAWAALCVCGAHQQAHRSGILQVHRSRLDGSGRRPIASPRFLADLGPAP